jgi:hypothetical protein
MQHKEFRMFQPLESASRVAQEALKASLAESLERN